MVTHKLTLKRLLLITYFAVFALALFTPLSTNALSGSDFNAGRIIDDSIFFNKNAMTAQQIQDFLNAKLPACWRNHPAYTSPSSGITYSPPFTCLKEYQENPTTKENNIGRFNGDGSPYNVPGGKSAAQIIWDAGQTYNINPQVLIVMLQKEQGLITDDWPILAQYNTAMGYACPDNGPDRTANCNASYYGFYNQIDSAAWQLRRYVTNPDEYNFKTSVTRYIQYNPDPGCGGSNVYLENSATAALYNYTPYQPNAGTLALMNDSTAGGTTTCGAYGNRNFFWYFTKWFGNTHGLRYTWDIVSFNYAGGDNIIALGQTEHVVLKAKNTGVVPWYNHGNNPVRLGTWNNPDRATTMLGGGNRFATLTESVVMPGSIGTFEFDLNPTQLGTFVEAMNIVAENSEWAAWPGFSPTITVSDGYNWQVQDVIYESGTGLMEQGQSQLITVKAKNTGTLTWSKLTGPAIRLATWEPDRKSNVKSNGWISDTRLVTTNETTVAPGQTAGFQFYVTMPTGGPNYQRLNLVAEGQKWFNDTGLTLYLEGKTYAWQPLWHSHSTGTANIARNTSFTLTVKVKNTGTMPWYKNSGPAIRLGTSSPLNRGTALYDQSWISDTRPAAMQENTVLPGQEGTFTFTAKTPSTPGPRNEHFNLVAEGLTWFNDPGFSIYVNVL